MCCHNRTTANWKKKIKISRLYTCKPNLSTLWHNLFSMFCWNDFHVRKGHLTLKLSIWNFWARTVLVLPCNRLKVCLKMKLPRFHNTIGTNFSYQKQQFFINSTLHGVRYFAEKGRTYGEKFMWFCFIAIGAVAAFVIIGRWKQLQKLKFCEFPISRILYFLGV